MYSEKYNVEYRDGLLFRKGRELKACHKDGRKVLRHGDSNVLQARAIWEMFNGPIPDGMFVDHIDGDKTNDKVENLRLAKRSENCHNAKRRKDNKSGVKNVTLCSTTGLWRVIVTSNKKSHDYGRYSNLEDASRAAKQAREALHGEFARHG